MDPVSALGLTASIIAVIQITTKLLKNVSPSEHSRQDLNRLLGTISGLKGVYEGLELHLQCSEEGELRNALLRQLEEPIKDCKLVLQCLNRGLNP